MKRQKTGGRKKGTPNKATAEVMKLAGQYTGDAIRVLSEILKNEESPEAARIAAAKELLDRGHGKPSQHVLNETIEPSPIDNIDFEALTDDQLAAITELPTKRGTDTEGAG